MNRWPTARLGEIAEVTAGNPAPQTADAFSSSGIPFVRMQDVGREHLTSNLRQTVDAIDPAWSGTRALRLFPVGTLLIPKSGASIELNHRAVLAVPAFVVSHLAAVLPKTDRIDREYLYWWSVAWDPRAQAQTTSLPSLPLSILQAANVPVPPLAEQRRIVDLLNRAAGIRRLREAALAKARETIPALFLSMFGDPATNPMELPTEPLSALVAVRSGGTPSRANPIFWNGVVPWVSPKDMKRDVIDSSLETLTNEAIKSGGARLLPRHAVLVVVRGMILAHSVPVGVAEVPVTINQDMKGLVAGERVCPGFLWATLAMRKVDLLAMVTTAAHGTKKLDSGPFFSMRIPLPPLNLQRAFASRLADLRAIISHQERALALARDTERALMAQLLG